MPPRPPLQYMKIPDEVTRFNVTRFCLGLGYKAAFAGKATAPLALPMWMPRAAAAGHAAGDLPSLASGSSACG